MVSPVLDEEHIKHLLKAPVTADYINALQAGAAGAAVDLYDRKVTRDEFADGLQKCLVLYAQCAKLFMLQQCEIAFKAGDFDQERIDKAETGLTEFIRRASDEVIELVKRLQLCAENEDKVH